VRAEMGSCSWAEMGHSVRGLPNPFAEGSDG